MRMTDDINPIEQQIKGFKTRITIKKVESAAIGGIQYLLDIRNLEQNYGLPNTFSFGQQYLDYESYFLFT